MSRQKNMEKEHGFPPIFILLLVEEINTQVATKILWRVWFGIALTLKRCQILLAPQICMLIKVVCLLGLSSNQSFYSIFDFAMMLHTRFLYSVFRNETIYRQKTKYLCFARFYFKSHLFTRFFNHSFEFEKQFTELPKHQLNTYCTILSTLLLCFFFFFVWF